MTHESCFHLTTFFPWKMGKCTFHESISWLRFLFFRTTSVRARLQDGAGGTETGGDPARGETPLLRDTDQRHPGEGLGMRRRKREEDGEEVEGEQAVD